MMEVVCLAVIALGVVVIVRARREIRTSRRIWLRQWDGDPRALAIVAARQDRWERRALLREALGEAPELSELA